MLHVFVFLVLKHADFATMLSFAFLSTIDYILNKIQQFLFPQKLQYFLSQKIGWYVFYYFVIPLKQIYHQANIDVHSRVIIHADL